MADFLDVKPIYNFDGVHGGCLGFDGVQVFDFLNGEELRDFHAKISTWVPPEFEADAAPGPLALGGFQALGFASSFHEPTFVRPLRVLAHERIRSLPEFGELLELHSLSNIEQLPDRVMIREPRTHIGKEQWHRDSPEHHDLGDKVLGGWINLDAPGSAPQRFICVPGTQRGVALPSGKGFKRITDVDLMERYFKYEQTFLVHPGQCILFYSHLVHRIASSSGTPHKTFRLFTGWRFTNSLTPLCYRLEERLERQEIVPLPSSQTPPLYPAAYINYFDVNKERMIQFARRLKPSLKSKLTSKYCHKRTGRTYRIPVRFAPSLSDLDLKYPAYTAFEKSILMPC